MNSLDVEFPDDQLDVEYYNTGYLPSDESLELYGARPFPDEMVIPRGEWQDRAREHDEAGTWPADYSDRFTHQGNSHECVSHASCQCLLIAWNKQLGSNKYSVWPSPLSLYCRLNPKQWGGSNVQRTLQEMIARGVLPEHDGPHGAGSQRDAFKHSLHQTAGRSESGPWVHPRNLPEGWEQTARHFRVLEAWTIPDRQAHASAILSGMAICNGRKGHSIPHVQLVWRDGKPHSKYKDSYNVFRYDSESLWGGGYCIRAVAFPDDPVRPAGEDTKAPLPGGRRKRNQP